ncbi:unnamed protein product, partial [Staurois parvus]
GVEPSDGARRRRWNQGTVLGGGWEVKPRDSARRWVGGETKGRCSEVSRWWNQETVLGGGGRAWNQVT